MKESTLLGADAGIHLLIGIILMFAPRVFIDALGIPSPGTAFYASVLGAILTGLGLSLLAERFRNVFGIAGLGLGGAICLNICVGGVLAAWLVRGSLPIPLHGYVLLWLIVVVLMTLSGAEFWVQVRQNHDNMDKLA
ncbi:MAG: hypothetical protein ACYDDO_07115 [Acidiferrobacterales bacterium]